MTYPYKRVVPPHAWTGPKYEGAISYCITFDRRLIVKFKREVV